MSLFGAATSGVDPQSGGIPIKRTEGRYVPRFTRNGWQWWWAKNSGGSGATVEPKAAIVVANKFSEITRTLNTNFQQSATNISDQARK